MDSVFNLGPIISDVCLGDVFLEDSCNLRIAHINAQSLCPSSRSHKLDELRHVLRDRPLDILCVSETWLDSSVFDQAVSIPGFTLCRSDRGSGARGGGVAIYIAEGINFRVVYRCTDYNCCEGLFLEINTDTDAVLIGVVYLPRGDLTAFDQSLSDLVVRYMNIVIVGDFNNNLFDLVKSNSVHMLCNRFGLKCHHNMAPTHYDSFHCTTSLIDYFMLSRNLLVKTSAQFQFPLMSHHSFICVSLSINATYAHRTEFFRDYNNMDRVGMVDYLCHLDFSPLYITGDTDVMWSFFCNVFNDLMDFVPLRRVSLAGRQRLLRFSNEVNYYRSLTGIALREFYRYRSADKWEVYRVLRNRTKSLIRGLKLRHGRRIFEGCSTSQMWKVLRGAGALSELSSDIHVDVNELNDYFISSQLDSIDDVTSFDDDFIGSISFSFMNITEVELFDSLCKIKSTSIGADGLSIRLLKIVYPFISRHLLHLINSILTSSKIPSEWKVSRIIPIPKVRGCATVGNMRPISILPIISKVLENIMNAQMTSYLDRNRLLSGNQYGFRSGRSTGHLLTELTETIRNGLNGGYVSILVLIDLSKAFDQVGHSKLIQKLFSKYNFSKSACCLIWSYLFDRRQYVSLNGLSSDLKCVRSGVPQGSVLGPLLFTLFLNDFFSHLAGCNCKALAFADDVQLLWTGSCLDSNVLESTVNNDLMAVHEWMSVNNLHVNPDKTKALIFGSGSGRRLELNLMISNAPIEVVGSLKCLGVIIDDKLSFGPHIDDIFTKVFITLRRLYRLNLCLPLFVRKSIANALLMSRINYCLEVYSGCNLGNRHRIESVVRKVVRYVYGLGWRAHVSYHIRGFLKFTFEDYLKFRLLIYLFKIIKFQRPENVVGMISFTRSLRNPQMFIPRIFNRVLEQSFVVRVARLWNTLPRQLRSFSFSVGMFKRNIISVFNTES